MNSIELDECAQSNSMNMGNEVKNKKNFKSNEGFKCTLDWGFSIRGFVRVAIGGNMNYSWKKLS